MNTEAGMKGSREDSLGCNWLHETSLGHAMALLSWFSSNMLEQEHRWY